MLQFENKTSFEGSFALLPDPEGVDAILAIVKGTFVLSESPVIAEKQMPVMLADVYVGEPGESSLAAPSDFAFPKKGTDVLLLGSAYALGGKPVSQLDVSLSVGPIQKIVRVFGERVWVSTRHGSTVSTPKTFTTMPLVWENAFGGVDVTSEDSPKVYTESRNPIGVGYRVEKSRRALDGLRLPNLEDPRHFIRSWNDRPVPACFGSICAHWEPRRSYAGTYDESWQTRRAPYLPEDFDPRFFQVAPPDQVVDGHLRGGEAVEVVHVTPSGRVRFDLPAYNVQVRYNLDGNDLIHDAALDTVIIEPDDLRFILVWRSVLSCNRSGLKVSEIEVSASNGITYR